jgi:hypothetical protein
VSDWKEVTPGSSLAGSHIVHALHVALDCSGFVASKMGGRRRSKMRGKTCLRVSLTVRPRKIVIDAFLLFA